MRIIISFEYQMDLSLGKKRRCEKCGTLFYDMSKANAQCPSCGATFVFAYTSRANVKQKMGRKKVNVEFDDNNIFENDDDMIVSIVESGGDLIDEVD